MNPDYKEIGKNIRLMRIRHGISQSELAQRLDVSQTHMSNLEHGRVSVSLRVLLRLAHFFKCSVDTLLGSVLQGHVVPEVNNDGYDIEDLALLLKRFGNMSIHSCFTFFFDVIQEGIGSHSNDR